VSTEGAPLLDATQWHLGTWVKWRLWRHDARTSGASQHLKGGVRGEPWFPSKIDSFSRMLDQF